MPTPPVTEAEVRAELNIPSGSTAVTSTELNAKLAAATELVEKRVGPMVSRTVTSTVALSDDGLLVLPVWPVLSVETVTRVSDATAVNLTLVDVDIKGGRINLSAWGSAMASTYYPRRGPLYTVAYTVGRSPVPDDLKQATLAVAGHLWETQRGQGTRPGMVGQGAEQERTPRGFALPNRALEGMEPYRAVGVS